MSDPRRILVTGAAGFIGAAVSQALVAQGDIVLGVDNLNAYYDPALKKARVAQLDGHSNWTFTKLDLADRAATEALFEDFAPHYVVHLAAQAGVRHSIQQPHDYASSNLVAFLHILEGCRRHEVKHLVFASSSSVYGANTTLPFSVSDNVDHPISLYAATKKANELMAHSYSHLYGIPMSGLRFFTVYGPWGRPDMALFLFTRRILAGEPIDVFNHGRMQRDFTYIDDIVRGVVALIEKPATGDDSWDGANPDPSRSRAPWRIFNIGNHQPIELMDMIRTLEQALGQKAELNFLPMQPGDVEATCADVEALRDVTGFAPNTPVEEGIKRFVEWYRDWYRV